MIDKKLFLELADVHEPDCISAYVPRTGPEEDRITLKNLIAEAEGTLSKVYGLDDREIRKKLLPLRDQLEKIGWLSRSGSGFAIFVYGDRHLILEFSEVSFGTHLQIANHLYLLPLAPLVHQDYQLYLLTLSANRVRLYEASLETFQKSSYSDSLPERIEEVVGSDYEQKSLQYRTGQQAHSPDKGMFHGHGSGNDTEKKEEYVQFFRAVDHKLKELTGNNGVPLVVACVDYLFPIFKAVSEYHQLYPDFIAGNYDHKGEERLREEARTLIKIWMKKDEADLRSRFHALLSRQKASAQLESILPAALEGKVEALIINEHEDAYGRYNPASDKLEVEEVSKVNNASLFNMAAVHTIRNGGKVFLVRGDQMPFKDSGINAIYRYSYQEQNS